MLATYLSAALAAGVTTRWASAAIADSIPFALLATAVVLVGRRRQRSLGFETGKDRL